MGFYNGTHSEIKIAQCDNWTEREVLDRGIAMLKFMENRWKIMFRSQEEMKNILFLEFVS